ncbi:MAG: hypothetical protein DWQ07_24815 [Chloroflexi bacterium]|nr:MAG: hypothetical protein DWQ07_24815 [Chloroflexota bacterium]MBL1197085.1 hypothetical protein [Chloroflexota bacterium]NOH14380.1 hypothetical protein [Chloroflexota bacterium]
MKIRAWFTFVIAFLLVACSSSDTTQTAGPSQPAGELPPPGVQENQKPPVEDAVNAYLNAWGEQNYQTMYDMLTTLSRDAQTFEDFAARYAGVWDEGAFFRIQHEIMSKLVNTRSAQVSYRVTISSALVGDFSRETTMDLSYEGEAWRVIWAEKLIFPELVGENRLSMQPFIPSRGIIYDRNGSALAVNTDAVAVGYVVTALSEENSNDTFEQLARISGRPPGYFEYFSLIPDAQDYYPVTEITLDEYNDISPVGATAFREYFGTRLYLDGGVGPHLLGYVGLIQESEVDEFAEAGYPVDSLIGRLGIEAIAEEQLAGERGGQLYVVSPENTIVTIVAEKQPQAAQSVFSTIDKDLQIGAQQALEGFNGAVVVLERDTGRVLAMAASPDFNQNAADFDNFNSLYDWPPPDTAFLNRATQGQYPPGSIFKVITMAAAIESELYTADSQFDCQHSYEFAGLLFDDWTLEAGLPPSGPLSLQGGLMRSCNPFFYDIGISLYNNGFENAISEMARGFGLGSPTGIVGFPEESGQIDDPERAVDSLQLAIGQHTTTITPIQAAVYVAALGNGGTLYQPQVIDRIEDTGGNATQSFVPVIMGELPISEDTLAAIQRSMRLVTQNERGTAYRTFANSSVSVAGKTGSAQNPGPEAHAWFIGFSEQGIEGVPDIAVAVVVEQVGNGSEFAAPIFRRMIEIYFSGQARIPFAWENGIPGVPEFPEEFIEEEGGEPIELDPSG